MSGNLLFVASTAGHIRNFHLPYLRALKEKGWRIHGAWAGDTGSVDAVERVIGLPLEKKMTAPGNFKAAAILRREIRAQGYDAVIVHTSLAAFFTRLAVLGMRKRPVVVNMVHGYLFDDGTSPLKRAILLGAEKLTAGVTDLLLTMNRWDYDTAVKHRLGKQIEFIPGVGVDFDKLERQCAEETAALRSQFGIGQDAFVMVYPAEFSARKSQSVLLRALSQLPENAVLVLPGSGALLESCKGLAKELGVEHRVVFPGYVKQMGPWYRAADCTLSASRSEGLPFNIMEAMHFGLCVVASDVKGHSDLICHGESGFLYPYGDASACAARVRQLMEQPQLARGMGQRAKECVENFGLERVLPQVMEQYEAALGENGRNKSI